MSEKKDDIAQQRFDTKAILLSLGRGAVVCLETFVVLAFFCVAVVFFAQFFVDVAVWLMEKTALGAGDAQVAFVAMLAGTSGGLITLLPKAWKRLDSLSLRFWDRVLKRNGNEV